MGNGGRAFLASRAKRDYPGIRRATRHRGYGVTNCLTGQYLYKADGRINQAEKLIASTEALV